MKVYYRAERSGCMHRTLEAAEACQACRSSGRMCFVTAGKASPLTPAP